MALRPAAFFIAASVAPIFAFAHGGGLDGYGCHRNRKQGGYHCHRGPLAGQSFASKEQMLKELQKHQGANAPRR